MKIDSFVSVVVLAGGHARTEPAALRALAALLQDRFTNYEVLVVVDTRTEGTAEALRDLTREVDCMRVLRISRRLGREAALPPAWRASSETSSCSWTQPRIPWP
jgi:glycosyltransferase involved in cell wall biosynthesis